MSEGGASKRRLENTGGTRPEPIGVVEKIEGTQEREGGGEFEDIKRLENTVGAIKWLGM